MTQLLANAPPTAAADDDFDPVGRDEDWLDPIDRRLNDEQWTEYADGRFIEKNVSDKSSYVGNQVSTELTIAARRPDRSVVARVYGSDQIYRCWPAEPKRSRRPDASVIRLDRWRAHVAERGEEPGEMAIAPDLAVEVISPGDKFQAVAAKLEEYLAAGFPLIWLIAPDVRVAHVYAGSEVRRLTEGDELALPDLLPAFRCRLGDLLGVAVGG